MAWPTPAGSVAQADIAVQPIPPPPVLPSSVIKPSLFRGQHYGTGRGCYRIYGTAQYLFYYDTSPITEDSDLDAVNSDINYETVDTFITGVYYFGARYTNGIYTSPLLPVGPNGETYYRLDVDSGVETISPPGKPFDVRLLRDTAGVIQVLAGYFESYQTIRANQFAINATFNGSDPGQDSPDYTRNMAKYGPQMLRYSLPPQVHGTTVKVRVQTRRNDGTEISPDYTYSETTADDVLTITADAQGPSVPMDAEIHPGAVAGEI